jgi:pyrroline-5-carboxylate reductase
MELGSIRLAMLGAGNMGGAVLQGAIRGGVAPANCWATALDPAHLDGVARRLGVKTTTSNVIAVKEADVVVVAVKPKDVDALLREIQDELQPHAIVVSVVAGLPISFFEDRLRNGQPMVRTMPNTPAAIGAGVAAISPGTSASDDDLALVDAVFAGTGDVVKIPESAQAAVGAISGSGPAYVFYILDALAEAGVKVGLSRELSQRLALGTVLGSASLLVETGEHPVLARERVTSPGGTTVRALEALDAGGVRAALISAVTAAVDRTNELQAELD